MITTKHSLKRIKERTSNSSRQVALALERGQSFTEFSGSFRRYLDKLRFHGKENSQGRSIIVYDNAVYIINNGILITIIKVPSKYLKYLKKKEE